ncbi:hypothetical protein DTO207G8_97 [Paecilomyces variotii]|nr:hypothetical protein DTO169C6_1672 [Paecilomyces variotii]KAJ9260947.1 hypothetical protein DTO207G8_97 [Paecilomyces variotii]KAJ9266909.1 hypothetical protein DTO195F2_844 [Paecilomyces variotii]KAJ9352692.1 hypothetical protein DTO027B9_5700 [Paecilomyces variotii]
MGLYQQQYPLAFPVMDFRRRLDERPPMKRDFYYVFGGPGAGKGTICARLAHDLGLLHVCVGDLLRDDPHLIDMEDAMREGRLMPNYVVANALGKELSRTTGPVLLDGFPRSQDQMMMFQHDTSNRIDDNIEAFCKRYVQFETETMPCVHSMRGISRLVEFDCSGDLDEAYEDVKNKLEQLMNWDGEGFMTFT